MKTIIINLFSGKTKLRLGILLILLASASCQSAVIITSTVQTSNHGEITPTDEQDFLISNLESPTMIALQAETPTILSDINIATATMTPFLTPTHTTAFTPTPSFQGRIAVLAITGDRPQDVYEGTLYAIDLVTQEFITIFEHVISFDWSPDGRQLILEAVNPDTWIEEIYLVNSDGTHSIKLEPTLTGEAHRNGPAWSPDGTQIAFSQPDAGEFLLHIMDIDGSDIHFITNGVWPSWSPDNKAIAFLRLYKESTIGDIFMIDVDGKNLRQLTTGINAGRPVWSPNGQYIAFFGSIENFENEGIYIMDADGGNLNLIIPTKSNSSSSLHWSPSSSKLIFARNGSLFATSIDGANLTLINLPEGFRYLSGALQPSP